MDWCSWRLLGLLALRSRRSLRSIIMLISLLRALIFMKILRLNSRICLLINHFRELLSCFMLLVVVCVYMILCLFLCLLDTWILTQDWFQQSLEKGEWLPENEFQCEAYQSKSVRNSMYFLEEFGFSCIGEGFWKGTWCFCLELSLWKGVMLRI